MSLPGPPLECHGGVTGRVLRPGVVFADDDVVVTFTVEADAGLHTCPGNDEVAYQVDLGRALGERALVDGACRPGGPADDTSVCVSGDVRWRPATLPAGVEPHECEAEEGSAIDVAHEPDWRRYADYVPWTDRDGCLVRIDVLAERPGPEHCEFEDAQVLITGQPLGTPYTGSTDNWQYVRDPEGVFDRPDLTAGFDSGARLPDEAIDTGYRRDGVELWLRPGDPGAVWLVSPVGVERWPAGESPVCG